MYASKRKNKEEFGLPANLNLMLSSHRSKDFVSDNFTDATRPQTAGQTYKSAKRYGTSTGSSKRVTSARVSNIAIDQRQIGFANLNNSSIVVISDTDRDVSP